MLGRTHLAQPLRTTTSTDHIHQLPSRLLMILMDHLQVTMVPRQMMTDMMTWTLELLYNQRAPSRPQPDYASQDGYQARSYMPANTSATPRPPPGRLMTPASTGATAHPPPGRSMTPGSYRSTPGPQSDSQTPGPQRNYTPFSPDTPSDSQSGYTAFSPNGNNPPMPSQTPQPRMQRPPGPSGYQPFTRANTASPSAVNRPGPAGYGFNRANTNQY